ncbi:MAG: M16 family metallopeptidase, partial [Rhodospirillales bacterium]
RVSLADARVRQPSWSRTYLAPSYRTGAIRHAYALEVLADLLGGGSTSRLYRSLVVDGKLAVSAGGYYRPDERGPGRFSLFASPKPGVAMATIEDAMEAEVARLRADGVTADEVARAKKRLQAEAVYARDSLQAGARTLGAALAIGMTVDDVESWPDRIGAVTKEDVDAAARAVLAVHRSVTATLLPKAQEQGRRP